MSTTNTTPPAATNITLPCHDDDDVAHKQRKPKTAKALRNEAVGAKQKSKARKGCNGLILKKYEQVICDMFSTGEKSDICEEALHHLTPRYSKLPPFINDVDKQKLVENACTYWNSRELSPSNNADISVNGLSSPWPFDKETSIPQCGCVRGTDELQYKLGKTKTGKDKGGVGNVRNTERAWRKEMQLANLIQCVLALLPDDVIQNSNNTNTTTNNKRPFRIVDFAGGTGHLAVPLALLLPQCEIICLDLKKWSLDLLHKRVDGLPLDNSNGDNINGSNTRNDAHKLPCCQLLDIQVSQTLPNLSTCHGAIQTYPHEFDIGVSLHGCGEASDHVLRKCIQQKASWVVCSCCCGKIQQDAKNPYVFQSTGSNEKQIRYPQSKVFASLGLCRNTNEEGGLISRQRLTAKFDELSKAADYSESEIGDLRKPKNACRRLAKSLVEWDRLIYTKECIDDNHAEANTILTRMVPWQSSPKNDILIGWSQQSCNPYRSLSTAVPGEDISCDADFEVALQHLFGKTVHGGAKKELTSTDQNDWTAQEENEMRSEIEQFLLSSADCQQCSFPKGMGGRKRKVVHFVAESMGLRHWGEGKKDADKIVVVARRRN